MRRPLLSRAMDQQRAGRPARRAPRRRAATPSARRCAGRRATCGIASLATSSDCTTTFTAPVERLDLVGDGQDRAVGERHEARRCHAHGAPRGRAPLGASRCQQRRRENRAPVRARAARRSAASNGSSSTSRRISLPLVTLTIVWPDSGAPYWLSASRQRTQLVAAVQVRAREPVRLALVEIAAHADEPVRQREQR